MCFSQLKANINSLQLIINLQYLDILWDGDLIVEVRGGDAGSTGTASFDWLVLFWS